MREAQLSQYNYILVVGEEEKAAGTVNVRTRDNQVGAAGHRAGRHGAGRHSTAERQLEAAACPLLPPCATAAAAPFALPQVHGQHPLSEVIEVMKKERDTRSQAGLFGGDGEAAPVAAEAAA